MLVTCINLITRNDWYTKADNLTRLTQYKEEEGARNIKKINDLYNTFQENEYELIRLFSSEPAKDRYGIDNYNWFIDFTKGNLAIATGLLKGKFFLAVIPVLLIAAYIFLRGMCNHNKELSFLKVFLEKKIVAILIIGINLFLLSILLFRPFGGFNYELFKKFYVISRHIKIAHSLYNICRKSKYLRIFLYNDLANLRSFFETEDKDLRDMINTAINSSPYRINFLDVKKIANFILRFDNSREKFHDLIFDFLGFKIYINTLQMNNSNNNMSPKWSTPTFINGNKSMKFKNLYNIALKKGGIPTDIYFDKNNKGLFFCETNDYSEGELQQALMLCLLFINGYGICPCEKAEICIPDYIHYTPDMFTDTDRNNNNLKKWISVATMSCERIRDVKSFYQKKGKGYSPTFFNIMNEVQGNDMESKMFMDIILNILKDDCFLYLIYHNKDVYEIKNKHPKLAYANKYIERDDNKNEVVNELA